jgi:hypothetical protein
METSRPTLWKSQFGLFLGLSRYERLVFALSFLAGFVILLERLNLSTSFQAGLTDR